MDEIKEIKTKDENIEINQTEAIKKTEERKFKVFLKRQFSKIKQFLKKQNIEISVKRYLIDAMGAMALGLFASLLIGTIIESIGTITNVDFFKNVGGFAKSVSGAAMACAIAYALKAPLLVIYSMLAVGFSANQLGGAGGPLAVYFIAIIATEVGKLFSKTTKIDIIVTPLITILVGCGLAVGIAPYIGKFATLVGEWINEATTLQPFLMGIILSVAMGICLTLPISSAAICAAFTITGLAGGAALAGCCCQMIGFAVMSYKENKISGLVAQGIGTSMIQMPNIIKKPTIWIPTILASAIAGPISTCLFKLEMNGAAVSSGMGTCGFVGQIGVITGWLNTPNYEFNALDISGLIMISFIMPIILTLLFHFICLKLHLYKNEDLKLDL